MRTTCSAPQEKPFTCAVQSSKPSRFRGRNRTCMLPCPVPPQALDPTNSLTILTQDTVEIRERGSSCQTEYLSPTCRVFAPIGILNPPFLCFPPPLGAYIDPSSMAVGVLAQPNGRILVVFLNCQNNCTCVSVGGGNLYIMWDARSVDTSLFACTAFVTVLRSDLQLVLLVLLIVSCYAACLSHSQVLDILLVETCY